MEQKHLQYIFDYLRHLKLPMDLALEVRDHMAEQVRERMDEGMDFKSSFQSVLQLWQKDLKVRKSIFPRRRITAIHSRSLNEIDGEILKRTAVIFAPFMVFAVGLSIYNFEVFKIAILASYIVATVISVVLVFPEYKLLRSSDYLNRGIRISIFQNGSTIFSLSSMYILIFNLLGFESKLERYAVALKKIINGDFGFRSIFFDFFFVYIFLFGWLIGVQYFLKFKKAYKVVKSQTNFRL